MKLRKISIAAVLLILIGFVFSSCENDYRTERSVLNYNSYDDARPMPLERVLRFNIRMRKGDIKAYSSGDISDIRLFSSLFLLKTNTYFDSNDRLDLTLRSGGRQFRDPMIIDIKNGEAFIESESNGAYYDFMQMVFRDLNRYDDVTLDVEINTNFRNGVIVPVHFEFNNKIDVELRRW